MTYTKIRNGRFLKIYTYIFAIERKANILEFPITPPTIPIPNAINNGSTDKSTVLGKPFNTKTFRTRPDNCKIFTKAATLDLIIFLSSLQKIYKNI